jgi:hypothetical protein
MRLVIAVGIKPQVRPILVAAGASLLGVVLELWVTASAAPPPCSTTENPRSTAYQFRSQMERCEGIKGSRPISALGLWLASFTIGEAQSEPRTQGGEMYRLLVPAGPKTPDVKVKALGSDYQMTPLRLGTPRQGWRPFEWGAGLIQRERISASQLRATALLIQPDGAYQGLPVKFSPAGAYSLVIASNASLPVANVRILGPGSRLVKECSGPTRLESELVCRWDARNLPAGTYRLVARSAEGGGALLNVSLRHNPSWLTR